MDLNKLIEDSYKEGVFHLYPDNLQDELKKVLSGKELHEFTHMDGRWEESDRTPLKFHYVDFTPAGVMYMRSETDYPGGGFQYFRKPFEFSFLQGKGFYIGYGVMDGAKLDIVSRVVLLEKL